MPDTKTLGDTAEDQALIFLEKQGLSLIERNYRAKGGEIDLIMGDGEHTVFIEVKYRQSTDYGDAAALVPYQKQRRIIRAATQFLVEKNSYNTAYGRFDIIGIFANQNDRITWIKNAFEVQY